MRIIAHWLLILLFGGALSACADSKSEIDDEPGGSEDDECIYFSGPAERESSDVTEAPPVEVDVIPMEDRALETWNLIDEHGRVIIPRGVNYSNVSKGETGLPALTDDETKADAEHFEELGFNVIRYLIQWKNIEPDEPGTYDEAYLDSVKKRLDILHENGQYVILDMHQDVYGPKFGFNGAPDWAVFDACLDYVKSGGVWSSNYLKRAVQAAFDNFFNYKKYPELQDAYVEMWKHTVERLKDHPAVLGYDIMNEPHPGSRFDPIDFGKDYDKSKSVAFDRERLAPFYQRVIDGIRAVDNDGWILYEPRYGAPGDGGKQYLHPLDDPREGARRLFGAPHLYAFAVEVTPVYNEAAKERVAKWGVERELERDEWYAGVYLGEFGTYTHVDGYDEYMNDVIRITEDLLIGFAAWAWDPYEFGMLDGERDEDTLRFPEGPFIDYLSRPYPRAIAGTPLAFSFDPEEIVFTAEWEVDHSIDAPTEIFTSRQRWFDEGWEIEISPEEGVSYVVVDEDEFTEQVLITVEDESVDRVELTFRAAE